MTDTGDVFDFVLAERLGMSVAAVRELSNDEYVGWHAYYTVKGVIAGLAHDTMRSRHARR